MFLDRIVSPNLSRLVYEPPLGLVAGNGNIKERERKWKLLCYVGFTAENKPPAFPQQQTPPI